ncbi:TerD family protein [Brevibacillus sp. HB1.2]|uniref:TerD family protein n=1 Tax=Brevibacillus porteri TaxID=2126350 RepID=A0ABX5FWN5_9BACL|nr:MULTISPECIES: TerD family protein [Brevibacillus]ATF12097.1 stress protein [Brevibacillus brevis X23]MDC0762765.1 TerD family protein [Brevibacillus sp. AG]MED1801027.1 TerD family protein [Brevibacillus porteri]MED2130413.1 TerD family protein [Brevibacillus porteri]MED2745162.1 TerD family protein [Brevibacillus porteri]
MSVVSLQKGQKIDLTKGNAGLTKLLVGLGWDPVKKSGGLLGGIFGGGSNANIDCDASVIMLDQNGKITKEKNLVYFGNKKSQCGSVSHSGDNLTGDGEGDDEQVNVDLSRVPNDVHKLVFVVNIYDCVSRRQDFGMIGNAYIRVVNASNNQNLCKFNLTDNYSGKTSLIIGELYRYDGEWKFSAIGEGTTDTAISQLVRRYS